MIREISAQEAAPVVLDEWVYSRVSGDQSPARESITPPEDFRYLGGFVGDKLVAVMILHNTELGQTCHFQSLKEYRQYANEFGDGFLALVEGPVYARIPTLYPKVVEFAHRHGFCDIGIEVKSFLKDGISYDRHIMVRV